MGKTKVWRSPPRKTHTYAPRFWSDIAGSAIPGAAAYSPTDAPKAWWPGTLWREQARLPPPMKLNLMSWDTVKIVSENALP
jgi:hypothetical protein